MELGQCPGSPRYLCPVPSPDTGYGTIYTSDDRGVVYSKSLERHLYTTTGGETDFTNVTSLRGIYITSVLSEGEDVAVTPPWGGGVGDLGAGGGSVGTCLVSPQPCHLPLLPPDNSIQSVITFDRGGEWVPLRKPKNTTCDSTARNKEEVALSLVPS